MNNSGLGKTIENVRKHRDIKLVTTEKRRNYFVSEANNDTKTFFTENLLAIEMEKTQILMKKSVYLGLSILDLNKTVIYKFWYELVKAKCSEKAKLWYMDTDSFIVYIKTNDIYEDIVEDVEIRFHTWNYELHKPLPKGKNEKLIGLTKDGLGGKIMKIISRIKGKGKNWKA